MPTIAFQLDLAFRAAVLKAFDIDTDPLVGPAQNEKFGDYQANVAMSLAKLVAEKSGQKTNPRAVAEQIKANLELGGMASEVSIAGPGFINVRLSTEWLNQAVSEVAADPRLGVPTRAQPQTVVVDYSGPNIAKEMHVGHIRSTIIGDAVARTLDFLGDRVVRQNHIGDWGTQFGKVILAIWYIAMAVRKRGDLESLQQTARDLTTKVKEKDRAAAELLVRQLHARHQADLDADPDGKEYFERFLKDYQPDLDQLLPVYQMVNLYEDKDLLPLTNALKIERRGESRPMSRVARLVTSHLQRHSKHDLQEYDAWWKVRESTLGLCDALYRRMNVQLTRLDERGESSYDALLPRIVRVLKDEKKLAVDSEGAVAVFIDGPDKTPLVIEKSDGEGYLYGTTDLAALWYRAQAIGAARLLYFVDSRQSLHFHMLFATARAAGWADGVSLEYAPFGTILGKDGKPFKTRSGDTVKLKDLLDEAEERAFQLVTEKNADLPIEQCRDIARAVGIGAVKYSDLSKDRTSDYKFEWDQMLALNGNTGPYLQYAYARIRSIFRKSAASALTGGSLAEGTEPPVRAPAALKIALEAPTELALAKHIFRLPDVLEQVSNELKPHHLTSYLYDLAAKFSAFYENCPVLKSEEPARSSRLALCDLTARTIALGLELLGIEHPEQM